MDPLPKDFSVSEVIADKICIESASEHLDQNHYLNPLIEQKIKRPGQENWLPTIYKEKLVSVFDLANVKNIIFCDCDINCLHDAFKQKEALFKSKNTPELNYPDPSLLFLRSEYCSGVICLFIQTKDFCVLSFFWSKLQFLSKKYNRELNVTTSNDIINCIHEIVIRIMIIHIIYTGTCWYSMKEAFAIDFLHPF